MMITSPTMTEVLSVCGELRTSQMSSSLSDLEFETQFGHSFQIVGIAERLGRLKRNTEQKEERKATAWIPLPAQYPMIGLTLVAPVVAIVVLEILYQISHRHHGLLDVYDSVKMATYLSRYISSSIVLLIATLFNSLDFAIASFAPYSLLRSGAVSSKRSLCFSLLGRLAPAALLDSIEARHISSVFSNSAGIIGSILTIVSSGLWVIDHAMVTNIPVIALAGGWDVSWHNSSASGDGGAGVAFDSFQHGSTALPALSWHNIAFPSISGMRHSPGVNARGDPTTQNITIQLEGLRPRLDCEVIPNEHLSIDRNVDDYNEIAITARPLLQPRCQHAGENGTDAFYEFSPTYPADLYSHGQDTGYCGDLYDLHLGPWAGRLQNDYGEDGANLDLQKDNPSGCPSIGIIFVANHPRNTSLDDISALLCSQKIEKVKLNVTYVGQDMIYPSIDAKIEPVIVSGAVEYLTNGTTGFDSFPYRVQTYLQNITRFQQEGGLDSSDLPYDAVMDHLIYGSNGTAAEDLAGKANRGRLKEAVENLYMNYMTFVIDQRFRQPIPQNSTDGNNVVSGTAYRYTSRLKMDFASKLTLQIMLATMTILGASAFWPTDLRGTLPRKPTTIASTLALFAGSDMCDEKKPLIPRDALWKHGKELDKALDGWLFSLGWWPKTHRDVDTVSNETDEASGDALLETKEIGGRRFGIDVGVAEQLGFR
jgi:hypothetical protein